MFSASCLGVTLAICLLLSYAQLHKLELLIFWMLVLVESFPNVKLSDCITFLFLWLNVMLDPHGGHFWGVVMALSMHLSL